jgi:hypothetical protein
MPAMSATRGLQRADIDHHGSLRAFGTGQWLADASEAVIRTTLTPSSVVTHRTVGRRSQIAPISVTPRSFLT